MYRQTRIAQLRASLWVSVPEQAASLAEAGPGSSLIVPDGQIVIAGADSLARTFTGSGSPAVGLRFDPGVLPQLLVASASELADRVTPVDEVIKRTRIGPRGTDGGAAASVTGSARTLLDMAVYLAGRVSLDPRPMALAEYLDVRSGPPGQTVAEAAAEFAYSPRQLRRLSAEWFGYGPKHLAKILRWQSACELIAAGWTRTAAASEVGYADAAHLRRDERSLIE